MPQNFKELSREDFINKVITETEVTFNPNNVSDFECKTPRLILRPVADNDKISDVAFYQDKLWGDAQVMEKFGAGTVRLYWDEKKTDNTVPDYAKTRIAGWIKRWENNYPWSGLTVLDRATGNKIGHIVIGGGELAYFFIPEVWNQRYGSEAAIALVQVAVPKLMQNGFALAKPEQKALGYPDLPDHIEATAALDNPGSKGVAEYAGLTTDGEINERTFGNKVVKRHIYKLPVTKLKEDYDARIAAQDQAKQAQAKQNQAAAPTLLTQFKEACEKAKSVITEQTATAAESAKAAAKPANKMA